MQNQTKIIITAKSENDKKLQEEHAKDIINGYVYVEKISYFLKLSMACNTG